MRRWGLRVAFLLLFVWIGRNNGHFIPTVLGYLLWVYLVWRAWPHIVADVSRLWFSFNPLRVSLSKARALRVRDNSTF